MFSKDDKRRLYQLMDIFLSGVITASKFCDEFYYSYNLEIDYDTLTESEQTAFAELEEVSSRFSSYKEDHEKYPGTYYTEEELRQEVIKTKERLE